MAEKFPRYGYLECKYHGPGLFSDQSILSFNNSCGQNAEGFFHNYHMKDGKDEKHKLVRVTVVGENKGLASIVLLNQGTEGPGGRGQGGFIQVKQSQIVYEK